MKYLNVMHKMAFGLLLSGFYATAIAAGEGLAPVQMTVYKSPTCGCCQKWVEHISHNHIQASVVESDDLSDLKTRFGIQSKYRSCHTGVVTSLAGDFVFEGHVPAEYVTQFLANPPAGAIGLSVPGMPVGSPGMEVGQRKDYYQVLVLNEDGSSSVFAHVNQQ